MELCKLTLKSIVTMTGIIFFVFSAFLLSISIFVMSSYGHLGDDIFKHFYTLIPVTVLFVAGIFFGLAGIVACFAAVNQNKCLLIILRFVLILLIAIMVLGVVEIEKSKPFVRDAVWNATIDAMDKYGVKNETAITNNVDFIQANLHCCGADSFKDWKDTPYYNQSQMYPKSCCNYENGQCNGTMPFDNEKLAWMQGCFNLVEDKLKQNSLYITIGTGIVLGVLVMMLLATCALGFYKRHSEGGLPYSTLAQ